MADMAMGVCQTGDHPKTRQCQGSSSSRNLGTHPGTLGSRIGFKHLVGKAAAGRALAKTHTQGPPGQSRERVGVWACGRVCVVVCWREALVSLSNSGRTRCQTMSRGADKEALERGPGGGARNGGAQDRASPCHARSQEGRHAS